MTTIAPIILVCPCCENLVQAFRVNSTNNFGGTTTEFRQIANGADPLEYETASCLKCGFCGYISDFESGKASDIVTAHLGSNAKHRIFGKPIGLSSRFEFIARLDKARDAPALKIGISFLKAAWCLGDSKKDIRRSVTLRFEAAEMFIKAVEGAEIEAEDKAVYTFLAGEVLRRAGDTKRSQVWFAKVEGAVGCDGSLEWLTQLAERQVRNPSDMRPSLVKPNKALLTGRPSSWKAIKEIEKSSACQMPFPALLKRWNTAVFTLNATTYDPNSKSNETFFCVKCGSQAGVENNGYCSVQIHGVCESCWPTITYDAADQERRAKEMAVLLASLDHHEELRTAISEAFAEVVAIMTVRDFESAIGVSIDATLGSSDAGPDEWQRLYDRFFDNHWTAFERFIAKKVSVSETIASFLTSQGARVEVVLAQIQALLDEPLVAYETLSVGSRVFHRQELLSKSSGLVFSREKLTSGYSVGTIVIHPDEMGKARARLRDLLLQRR